MKRLIMEQSIKYKNSSIRAVLFGTASVANAIGVADLTDSEMSDGNLAVGIVPNRYQ
jgi:uncharacterized protein YaiL (DUF2058 family)